MRKAANDIAKPQATKITQIATYRRKIILSARKRVSKGDFSPQTPFDTPFASPFDKLRTGSGLLGML
jgi:hypothetical protein